jgi:Domain of unknown function (DUF3597)
MSIFGSIMNKIFRRDAGESPPGGTPSSVGAGGTSNQRVATGSAGSAPAASATAGGGSATVDVEAVLGGMAAKNGQKLDWRKSIVDLMKLLDLDSSLAARKELAKELNYTGDTNDSAKMNVWLHKQVMQKLAENGGKVPESLRS